MITLSIETSTPQGSVAIHDGRSRLFAESFAADRTASARLFPLLQTVLASMPAPEQICVGLGPGSYAGVRIAIAAAMGLEMALACRLVGLPSVVALDRGAYIAVGDARRDTFYWTQIESGRAVEGPLLLPLEEFTARLARNAEPIFSTEPLALVPQSQLAVPSAALLAELAATGQGAVIAAPLEPIYLREPHITRPAASPAK